MGLGVLIDLQRLEVLELVEAQQAVLPELRIVDLAFFEQQLAADDLVACDGVALELDARDVEGLAFVDVDLKRNGLLGFVEDRFGDGAEVDIAELAVGLLQVVQPLPISVALNQSPSLTANVARSASPLVSYRLVAGKGDRSQAVAAALFDRHEDVDALAGAGTEGEPVETALVANLRLGVFDRGGVVALSR